MSDEEILIEGEPAPPIEPPIGCEERPWIPRHAGSPPTSRNFDPADFWRKFEADRLAKEAECAP